MLSGFPTGAFAAWPDGRNGTCRFATNGNCDLYIQRLPEPGSSGSLAAGFILLLALRKRQLEARIRTT